MQHGCYGIPRSVVEKMSIELDRSVDEVTIAMDTVRIRELGNQCRLAVSELLCVKC
jgi:hypothetical protein